MKKIILGFLTFTILTTFCYTSLAASPADSLPEDTLEITVTSEDGQESVTTINLDDCYAMDPENLLRIPMTSHTLKTQQTMNYYNNDGSRFRWTRNQRISVRANFSKKINYEIGLDGAGYHEYFSSNGRGYMKSVNASTRAPADGSYYIYIKNESSDTVTVSGNIDWGN